MSKRKNEITALGKTPKRKIDKIIGITILAAVGLFVGRYYLQKVPSYREVEGQIAAKLYVPQAVEKVVEVLNLGDERDTEEFQQAREDRLERERRPKFDIEVPFGTKVEPQYRVIPLMDKAYYPALQGAIRNAKESIYVAMYVISMGTSANDPARNLLNQLIAAGKRGVDVKVILENPTSTGCTLYKRNEEAIAYLRDNGIEASFDEPRREVHDKFVLIDRDTVFVGNHNWSKAALTINREVSVMVTSHPADPDFVKHFANIKLAKPEETEEGRIELIKELYKELLGRDKEG
ncbi:MAG: phospholipase D-like domain-containing protein [PVC group bacterium]